MRSRALPLVVVVASLFGSIPSARAQDNSAAVEALFGEGKRLASEGKYSEACPKFFASYSLEHRLGTLLNLADCYEKNHQLASAWARFVEARTLAQRSNQADRAEFAAQHAAELEPQLSKLTVNVLKPAAGLEVKRDGVLVGDGAYGVAVAVDAGKYTIVASAPDRKPWTGEVTVGEGADQKMAAIEVPELVAAPKPLAASRTTVAEEKHGPGRAIAGLAIAGAGVVALGVGTSFGVAALGKKSDSNANGNCGAGGQVNDCNGVGVGLRDDARTLGNVSTVLIAVGGVAVAAGLVVWLTAPSSRVKTTLGFDGRMVRLGGAF